MNVIGNFEYLLILMMVISIIFIFYNLILSIIFLYISVKKNDENFIDNTLYKYRLIIFLFINFLLISLFLGLGYFAFSPTEKIIHTSPENNGILEDYDEEIEITFNRPIRKDVIELYSSDKDNGRWEFVKSFDFLPFTRKIKYIPDKTFSENETVKLYLVNFNREDIGEFPLDFSPPATPNIQSISPLNGEDKVNIAKDINIQFDRDLKKYGSYKVELNPGVKFIQEVQGKAIRLNLQEDLKQDTNYQLTIVRKPHTYNLNNGEVEDTSSSYAIHKSRFRTVQAPLIEEFTPQGDSVLADREITILFEEGITKKTVEENIIIEPKIEYEMRWENGRKLIIDPTNQFIKGEKYFVTIEKGIKNEDGGITKEDIKFDFGVIGNIKVIATSPTNGAEGVENDSSIRITFDQKVDQKSAQNKFSISPFVDGNFSWSENTMIYTPNADLPYNQLYQVNLASGIETINGLDSNQRFNFSFRIKENITILEVPHRYQRNSFACNCASISMILAYYGINVDESDVYNNAGQSPQPSYPDGDPHAGWVPNYGVYWEPIASYVRSQGLNAQVYQNWSLTDALKEVEQGNPVLVWWQNGVSAPTLKTFDNGTFGVNGMHSVVIVGYAGNINNPSRIYYHDPYFGALRTRTPSSFDYIWSTWRINNLPSEYVRVGLVVR